MSNTSSVEARLDRETLLGSGLESEVFSWGDGHVLKLCFSWVPEAAVEREFKITRAIASAGVPAPAAFEVLRVGRRLGIVFERVHGHSMLSRAQTRPWTIFSGARELAELHARIHSVPAPPGLPAQREQIEAWIADAEGFTVEQKAAAREQAAKSSAGSCLCHGDFHPGNIFLTDGGPVIVDWAGATSGHALADVGRTSVLFESAKLPDHAPFHLQLIMKVARRLLHQAYLKRYEELRPGTLKEIEAWRIPQRMFGPAWKARKRDAMAKSAGQA